jgi:hypothetical protein
MKKKSWHTAIKLPDFSVFLSYRLQLLKIISTFKARIKTKLF